MMIVFLPGKVERGAMEPELVKSADGYWADLKEISKIATYRSVIIGCIFSTMITGAATVFFPDFVSLGGVVSGSLVPCVTPPCEYTEIVFRFGAITILAGFGGAIFAIYGTKIGHRQNNQLIEAELCGFGCLIAGMAVYLVIEYGKSKIRQNRTLTVPPADKSLNIVWFGSFLVIFGVSINWGLSTELVIKVRFYFYS